MKFKPVFLTILLMVFTIVLATSAFAIVVTEGFVIDAKEVTSFEETPKKCFEAKPVHIIYFSNEADMNVAEFRTATIGAGSYEEYVQIASKVAIVDSSMTYNVGPTTSDGVHFLEMYSINPMISSEYDGPLIYPLSGSFDMFAYIIGNYAHKFAMEKIARVYQTTRCRRAFLIILAKSNCGS